MNQALWKVDRDTRLGSDDEQVWVEEGNTFVKIDFRDHQFLSESHDAACLGGRFCERCFDGQHLLPPNFQYCPECGEATRQRYATGGVSLCQWPSMDGKGWAECPKIEVGQLDGPRDLPIGPGDWALLVAGNTPNLIAFDNEHGQVHRWDENEWNAIARLAPADLHPWQRALAGSRWGIYFPGRDGLSFVSTPFVSGTRIIDAKDTLGAGRPLAGVCATPTYVCLPVSTGNSVRLDACALNLSPCRDVHAWTSVSVEGGPELGDDQFSAPFSNGAGDFFFAGANSYIAISGTDMTKIFAKRIAWRSGFNALPSTRPYRSPRTGNVWQFGRYNDPGTSQEQFGFHMVSFSSARQEIQAAEGPHLSFGAGTFRGDKRYEDPWRDEILDYELASNDSVYVPVATFGSGENVRYFTAILQGREHLIDLVSPQGMREPADARLFALGQRQGSMNNLQAAFRLQAPTDLSATIFGDQVLIYSRCENRIVSWRIEP